jgi:putative phosphoesterase
MRIGVISDTHGLVRPEVFDLLHGVELILHAGDIGEGGVIEELNVIAPVHAVGGNNDPPGRWKERLELNLGGRLFYLTHILGSALKWEPGVRDWIARKKPDFFIYGHTHRAAVDVVDGITFINPGSAGRKRFHLEPTLATMTLNGNRTPDITIHHL